MFFSTFLDSAEVSRGQQTPSFAEAADVASQEWTWCCAWPLAVGHGSSALSAPCTSSCYLWAPCLAPCGVCQHPGLYSTGVSRSSPAGATPQNIVLSKVLLSEGTATSPPLASALWFATPLLLTMSWDYHSDTSSTTHGRRRFRGHWHLGPH